MRLTRSNPEPSIALPPWLDGLRPGGWVMFNGADDVQARGYQAVFDDPRPHLVVGGVYEIDEVEIGPAATGLFFDWPGLDLRYGFNSVCFLPTEPPLQGGAEA